MRTVYLSPSQCKPRVCSPIPRMSPQRIIYCSFQHEQEKLPTNLVCVAFPFLLIPPRFHVPLEPEPADMRLSLSRRPPSHSLRRRVKKWRFTPVYSTMNIGGRRGGSCTRVMRRYLCVLEPCFRVLLFTHSFLWQIISMYDGVVLGALLTVGAVVVLAVNVLSSLLRWSKG